MGGMLRAKTILGHNNFTAIYDKGYHTEVNLIMPTEIQH
jgi:hypothetical protein